VAFYFFKEKKEEVKHYGRQKSEKGKETEERQECAGNKPGRETGTGINFQEEKAVIEP